MLPERSMVMMHSVWRFRLILRVALAVMVWLMPSPSGSVSPEVAMVRFLLKSVVGGLAAVTVKTSPAPTARAAPESSAQLYA